MKPYMLSDETIYYIKQIFDKEMTRGLDHESSELALPMSITYVTDHYKESGNGNFVSICAHAHNFTITLVKLKYGSSPEIHKKDYVINPKVFTKPFIKIYDAFAKCLKKFFLEYHLDGEIIPASFCTNLNMEQYSLDTAIIPYFIPGSKMYRSQRDIKASFERVLRKDDYQDETNLIKASNKSHDLENFDGTSDTERIFHAVYDAKLLGSENVQGLEASLDLCHNLLLKFQKLAFEIGEPTQKILLDISHAGVKVQGKIFKNSLYHHPIHKISHIVQDFSDGHNFGYLCGDFLKGHQFFGFKTDKSSIEVVSLLRNIFAVELIRKKKEKLEMQASQVYLTLKNFINLANELKMMERKIPCLLKQQVDLVEDINWWLEGCFEETRMKFEVPKESILHVGLYQLYAAACKLKQIEIEKQAAAKLEQEKLSGKRRERKKKDQEDSAITAEDSQGKEAVLDPLLVKVSEIITENIREFENVLGSQKEQLSMIKKNLETVHEFSIDTDHENLNDMRNFCSKISNIWNQENKSLEERIKILSEKEDSERGKIHYKIPSIYVGKKQYLKVTKNLLKVSIFEDTDFVVPKRLEKAKSDLLNKVLTCELYFLNALKMRQEEVEELNYFISGLHFRQSIFEPEDTRAMECCRRLFVKAVKMRLKEIQDIDWKLKELKNTKEKILYMIPDMIQNIQEQFQFAFKKRKSTIKIFENLLSAFHVDLKLSEESRNMCLNTLVELKMLIEKNIMDIDEEITNLRAKEKSAKNIMNVCFHLYNQTMKMRKKEFDVTVSDLDLFETIYLDSNTEEELDLIQNCQEVYITVACMREKEIESLEFQIKTVDKEFKTEDSQVAVTLKDLFYAAIELEKCECEKILQSSDDNDSSDMKVMPVVYDFKNLYEVVALHLKKEKSNLASTFKGPQVHASLREFLTTAFGLKQKEIEIPLSDLKKDLGNVLVELTEEVKKRQEQKKLKHQIHEQASRISRCWKEVFLVAMGMREKKMNDIILSKRKEMKEEEAVLQSLKYNEENMDNEANQVVKSWKKILSIVIDMKNLEMEQISQIFKKPQMQKDQKTFMPKSGTGSTVSDDDDEGYFELDEPNTLNKGGSPSEEILNAITSCEHIYSVAVDKGSVNLEEMEYEMRPIFSEEYDEEKADLLEDEVARAVNKSCHAILSLFEGVRTDISSMKMNLESLSQVQDNIKSQTASVKATCTHFLTMLLELEENSVKTIEEKLEELNKAFENLQLKDSKQFRPFTDLLVDVMSDEELVVLTDTVQEEALKENELEPQDVQEEIPYNKLTKEEIYSVLAEVESELKTDDEVEQQQKREVMTVFDSCKTHLELAVKMRREIIDSVQIELEKLKLPDPKKMKPKDKVQRALKCIVNCKDIFTFCINFRQSETKNMLTAVERMKATQNKEQIVVEFEPAEIVGSCRELFISAVETRKRNIAMMEKEIESLETKKCNIPEDIKSEAISLMKSEIYVTCKDLVLESVDLKMKEIDDIASHCELLNNIELKIGIHLKQLDSEKQKATRTKLEKAKDAVATCKKLCSSASEKAKKEVRDTDEELGLLKGALESSETSLITSTCKNLLMTIMEKRESEVAEMERELGELKENVQDLLQKLADLNLSKTDDPSEVEENSAVNLNQEESDSTLSPHTDFEVEKDEDLKVSVEGTTDMERICKIKINMITDFLQECKGSMLANIQKKNEEISSLESDLDKIKVTVQKVEGEDVRVFSICHGIFTPIIEMRREEMQSFETELKVLQKLIYENEIQDTPPSQKAAANEEESEVALAIASCKRVLNLAIKNRKSEKDSIDFELMKLVRYQDSRITNICKQFLTTTVQKSYEEMGIFKTKLLRLEGTSLDNETEILNVSVDLLEKLFQATKEQIDAIVLAVQVLSKRKIQMAIEEHQFVVACKKHLSAQMDAREREITVFRQELETVSEHQSFEEGFDAKVLNMKVIYENMYAKAISIRKKEIETFKFELIKHHDIKVSEEISVCQKYLETFIEELKNELKVYDSETEGVANLVNAEKEEMWTTLCRLQKLYSTILKKRIKDCKSLEEILRSFEGKKRITEKEKKFDIKAPLQQEVCCEKLKTDATLVISGCKEILYSIIEVAETEIRDINLAKEELKRQEFVEEEIKKRETFSFHADESSTFTEKEIALLEALEQDILNSKSVKNQKVMDFCEHFFMKSNNNREELIQFTKQYLGELSDIEEELIFEAAQIVYFMMTLIKSTLQEQAKERRLIHNDLQTLENIKAKEKDENVKKIGITQSCQEMLTVAAVFKREIMALFLLSTESIKKKEEELKVEISKVYQRCGDHLLKMIEMIEIDTKHLTKDLESLKEFGILSDEDESKLSEDEKAIRKCKLFLLDAIDNRKKLSHSIHLELKFLEGGIQSIRVEESKVFPSWYSRFLTFLDMSSEDSVSHSIDLPSVLHNNLEKNEVISSGAIKSSKSDIYVQKSEKFKDLLKSLEQKQKKQPIWSISSWDDILLRSYLMEQIEKNSLEIDGKQLLDSSNKDIKKDKNWDEIFFEANNLLKKQLKLAAKLKKRKQLFGPISSWSQVFNAAIDEWNTIVKMKASHLKNESLLLEWRGKMESKENLKYSSGCQYGLQSTKFDQYAKHWTIRNGENGSEGSSVDIPDLGCETSFVSPSVDSKDNQPLSKSETLSGDLSSWNSMFTKSVDLIEEGRKAYNFMRKKNTKLQSEVIKVFSSWDELFSKAIKQRKIDFQEEEKQNNVLKDLAKIVNTEIQGKVQEHSAIPQSLKFDSWIHIIYKSYKIHKSELLNALNLKKREMEKSSKSGKVEAESVYNSFLTVELEILLNQGKKLFSRALEIRKKEIKEMEKDLKSFKDLNEIEKSSFKEIPQPILIWKLITSVAVSFKASGRKFELQSEKRFNQISNDLFSAALRSKLKEMECYESYWKKFTEKQFFLDVVPTSISWSAMLDSISELTKKDIMKMSMFGITVEQDEKEHFDAEDAADKSIEACEDSACWTDLILAALEQQNYENMSEHMENSISENEEEEQLMSWDEIFFFMNHMCKETIKEGIFGKAIVVDYAKLKDIRHMVSSNYFTWDTLINGVIKEMLFAVQGCKDEITSERKEFNSFSSLIDTSENFKRNDQKCVNLREILKKFGVKSFTQMLPSEAGATKLEMEDILKETRRKILLPHTATLKKEFNDNVIWKCIFPIAVEVWRMKMKSYLDFQDLHISKNSSVEKLKQKFSNSNHEEKFSFDSKHPDGDFNSLKELEKAVAYEYISNIDGYVDKNSSWSNEQKNQMKSSELINKFSSFLIDDMKKKLKDGENMTPKYFYVPATWYEIFKAAFERYKQFLYGVIDLKEIEGDCLENFPTTMVAKSDVSDKKVKFQASNVLHQKVTLQDLLEIVDSLKKKNLVVLKDIKEKDTLVEDAFSISSESLDVSDVIESFKGILIKAFKFRNGEKNLLEQESEKLISVSKNNCERYRAFPVIQKLVQYSDIGAQSRSRENESINLKLESLNEFKCIFSGYLECPVTESLLKRNVRRIEEQNYFSEYFKNLLETLKQNLRVHFNSLITSFESSRKRRMKKMLLVDVKRANELGEDLDSKDQEIFSNSKKIFSSVIKLRKDGAASMAHNLLNWKKIYKFDESLENTIHTMFSSILKFFDNEISERKSVTSLILQEKKYFQERNADLKSKISLALNNCQHYLFSAITDRKNDISLINSGLISLKSKLKEPNRKTLEGIALCEEYCTKFVEKRESEIQLLEECINNMEETEIHLVQAMCLEYSVQAITNRKIELKVIEDYTASFEIFDDNLESELSVAIEEALADVIDLSGGMTFFHALSEKKESHKEKMDPEILKNCSEFYVQREEDVMREIKTIEENSELLKSFKGNIALIVISVLEDFEALLDNALHSIKLDCDNILSEQNFIKSRQSCFCAEIVECLINCRKHFEESLTEIERDLYVLRLQLNILSEELDELDKDISSPLDDTDNSEDLGSAALDKENIYKSSPESIQYSADKVCSEESSIFTTCYNMLHSALELRLSFIGIFTNEIKSFDGSENKAFKILTECADNIWNMSEKRKLEKQKIEEVVLPLETISKTDIVYTCMECIYCLLQYDAECLTSLMPDLDRLKCTVMNMERKRSALFAFFSRNLQSNIDLRTSELQNMNSELMCMECMQSVDDSQWVTSSKLIFQKGIENRNNEIAALKHAIEILKSEIEILPVVNLCKKHLQTSVRNRKEEISSIKEQIDYLENEAATLLLVYSPGFETITEGNKNVLEDLIPVVLKVNKTSQELKLEEEKIIESCRKLYSNMLETLKIEREAIKYDIDSLQEVELEKKDIIDTEGKELVVSFKDLYLAAFNLKKSNVEKDLRKRNIEENIKIKEAEIIETFSKNENENGKENEPLSKETFERFVQYWDTKKEKRRSMIDEKIMNEFEDMEKMLMIESDEKISFEMTKYSEDSVEEDVEKQSKTEQSFNRVYEVKVKEIEEDIKYRKEKITNVIRSRKNLMENILMRKKRELEQNIATKEKEMRDVINSIKGRESNVICSLNDLFCEIQNLKKHNLESPLVQDMDDGFQAFYVSVKLENFIDIVLEIKEEEIQMMLQSKLKDVDKIVSMMRKEVEKLIFSSKEKLEEALKQYRRTERLKAMEYAVSGVSTDEIDAYVICEDDIFPNINYFYQYVESFKGFFVPSTKSPCVYEDITFRSEEILWNNPASIPLFRKHFPMINSVPNHVLKLLEVEISSLLKILSEMNLDKAKAILEGLSFISGETIVHDATTIKPEKEILLDIVAVLNDGTSMLVLGSFMDCNCDISLNLDKDCSLIYFEKIENIKKWCPTLDSINEVAIDIGLKHFGKTGCLDDLSTKIDWAVTTLPLGPSRFERFIADDGLLEQIKFAFLELHHHHLLCRNCNFPNHSEDFGLSFDHVTKLLSTKDDCTATEMLPLSSGIPSSDDVTIASYVSKIILIRGAMLTAVCLSTVLQRLEKSEITVITTSFFIQESSVYRKILKTFLSALSPGKQVNFIFCKKSNCGVGASIMASIANQINNETPHLYLLELQQRLKNQNKLFSVQSFFKLLSNPNLFSKAVQLAQLYIEEMKFDLPLAVVWAYNFINEKIEEAENICKMYPISLSKVGYLVCRKISFTKNLELGQTYVQFLKTFRAEQHVRESAYKTLFDLLFYKDMYQEAVAVIQECVKEEISLTKLSHSALTVLHDFCVRESKKGGIASFSLPPKDFDSSSSDSDTEDL